MIEKELTILLKTLETQVFQLSENPLKIQKKTSTQILSVTFEIIQKIEIYTRLSFKLFSKNNEAAQESINSIEAKMVEIRKTNNRSNQSEFSQLDSQIFKAVQAAKRLYPWVGTNRVEYAILDCFCDAETEEEESHSHRRLMMQKTPDLLSECLPTSESPPIALHKPSVLSTKGFLIPKSPTSLDIPSAAPKAEETLSPSDFQKVKVDPVTLPKHSVLTEKLQTRTPSESSAKPSSEALESDDEVFSDTGIDKWPDWTYTNSRLYNKPLGSIS